MSDPKSGTDESLGRALNGMAAAYDFKQADEDVKILFQGAGTRWPEVLQNEDHPANRIFKAVEDKIEGVSAACSQLFGANPSGFDLISGNNVPNTAGLPSLVALQKDGYSIIVF